MQEDSLTETILRTGGLLLVLGLIVLLGWNEPLKYRFMSRVEIYALENPPTTPGGTWMWQKSKGTLDRGAYNGTRASRPSYRATYSGQ